MHNLKKRYLLNNIFKVITFFSISLSCLLFIFLLSSIFYHGYKAFFIKEVKMTVDLSNDYVAQSFVSKSAEFIVGDLLRKNPKDKRITLWLPVANNMKYPNYLETRKIFNKYLLMNSDSRIVEYAGIAASMIGSMFTLLVSMIITVPLSIATAIYLEKYAKSNIFNYWLEININNLASMPSIVFGLVGLLLFIGIFNLPRSSSIVAGLTLALMVMPSIIITSRNAIKSVPKSIEEAALALGASSLQILLHHILPNSFPAIMTGIIFAISRAIGETAPLILIGMVAFIIDVPTNIFQATTTMPVQIFLWSNSPEVGFMEKTSAAIIILLVILFMINIVSIVISKKFKVQW